MPYDASIIQRFFDGYGDREWERFNRSPQDRVNLHIHTHYLEQFIEPGMEVLDAGAGPGRFTIELAHLGARVTVLELSAEMLEQNRQRVREAGFEQSVVARDQGDITDLARYPDNSFDAVVCYGGPLSYVLERADDALAELLRVAKPGAPLLLSLMSSLGSTRALLPAVLELARDVGSERILGVLEDGLLTRGLFRNDHVLKMYRWQEVEALLARHACKLEVASASNFLTTGRQEAIDELVRDDVAWQELLAWELRCCREPGALDSGTHILAVIRKDTA